MPRTRGTTGQRGYGNAHQQLRKATIAAAYGQPCTRCGEVMSEGQYLDLDHSDDRTGYVGYAHRSCNRRAGAEKLNALRRASTLNTSRAW